MKHNSWQFWIDRGGTFTDIVALSPKGVLISDKLLSENPEQYSDAAVEGIKRIVSQSDDNQHLPFFIRMGTTVATNALLERNGDATLLVITKGLGDALRIGYQHRPELFSLKIHLPDMLYTRTLEADERISAQGNVLHPLDEQALLPDLQQAFEQGIRSVAIVLMHGYRYTEHESRIAALAKQIG
ncbi:MAG: 5-oxoprolinase, partial [Gammaproteobacteria bacterium]|nr:5-oxoprolinase [Gammaproteobacteria bacterium]